MSDRLSIKKSSAILLILLPGIYTSDLFYGCLNLSGYTGVITPGVVIRGGIFLWAVVWSVKYRRHIGKRLCFLCWSLLLLALLGPIISFFETLNGSALAIDVNGIAKVLYWPFVMLLFIVLIKRYRMTDLDIFAFVEYAAYFLGCSLLLMQLFSIGKLTYGDYAYGSTGIFHAQNDLTLALGIALVPAAYRNIKNPSLVRIVLLIAAMSGCVGIGTRASLAVVIIVPAAATFVMLWSKNRSHAGKRDFTRKMGTVVIIGVLGIGASWAVFHAVQREMEYGHQQKKFESLASGELPRLLLIRSGVEYFGSRDFIYDLLGEGRYRYERGVYNFCYPGVHVQDDQRRMAEVDWMDLYGAYGIIFAILLHGFYLALLFGVSKDFILRKSASDGLAGTMILIYLGHSVLAGHALVSPIPSTLIAAAGGLHLASRKKDAVKASKGRYMRSTQLSGLATNACNYQRH
jgi:hypothetical protein